MLIVLRPHPGGGIGNYLFQLCHSITYAQIREATLVVPRPIAFRTMNEEAIAFDFSSDRRSFDPNEIEVLPSFIHGNSATQLLSFAYRYHCMQEYVKPLFDPSAGHESLGDDTLAIHIRSGDIFQPDGSNPKYGQPPLSWYQLLIEKSGYEDIVLVTQTRFVNGGPNPVVAEIQRRWPHVRVLSEGHRTRLPYPAACRSPRALRGDLRSRSGHVEHAAVTPARPPLRPGTGSELHGHLPRRLRSGIRAHRL